MQEHLATLVRLQHLDERIRVQQRRLDSIPAELSERESALSARDAQAEQHEAQRKANLARARDLENDAAQAEARVAKLDRQALEARDAGSAEIARHEAEALRAKIGAQQEEALNLMEDADRLATERDAARAALDEERGELGRFREIVDSDLRELGAEAEAMQAERNALLGTLPTGARQVYEKIAGARGRAVAVLRGNSCGGCGTSVPPNEQIKVQAAKAVIQCRACARILVPQAVWAGAEA